MFATFNRFEFSLTKAQALAASHQGDCQSDAEEIADDPAVSICLDRIGPDAIRAELAEYGAWDESELSDDAQNRIRIIWIAAGDIRESLES